MRYSRHWQAWRPRKQAWRPRKRVFPGWQVFRGWRGAEALTLIEVLASLALLGSLLAATLIARGQMAHQWLAAQEKLEAVEAAGLLLEDWDGNVPRQDQGRIEDTNLSWRTRPAASQPLEDLGVEVVRLEVSDATDGRGASMLVSVELLAPMAEPRREREEGDIVARR